MNDARQKLLDALTNLLGVEGVRTILNTCPEILTVKQSNPKSKKKISHDN